MSRTTLISAGLTLPLMLSAALGQSRFATVYTFTSGPPLGLSHASGAFYLAIGGVGNITCGAISELLPPASKGGTWTENTVHTFATAGGDACGPTGAPVPGPSRALYGVSYGGGAYFSGGGTAYELQPPTSSGGAWTESVIYSFTALGQPGGDGGTPYGLIASPSGSLYTPTSDGGIYENGSAFELTPPAAPGQAWTGAVLYSFPGGGPMGAITDSLAFGPGGVLYGANQLGAAQDSGTIFELFPPTTPGGAWTETTLYTFQGFADGAVPNDVILGPGGVLYGTTMGTTSVSNNGAGTVFQLTPPTTPGAPWTKTILKSFGHNFNCGPDSPLVLRNGGIYGAACLSAGGVVFKLDPPSSSGGAWTYTALHTFTDGQVPAGGIVVTKDGRIYGTTINPANMQPGGTVYEIVP
ncbi:MAG: hypothetical protein ABSH32_25425 [Bryobacteraceae bacterium]|jgi:hypothetical protein